MASLLINIDVPELERAIAFYTTAFELRLSRRFDSGFAELVGAKDKTPPTDGISFAPTLLGEKQPGREFLYREFHGYGGQQILRMGDWKLVRSNLAGRGVKAKAKAAAPTEELFNIATDPAETKDVAAGHPDIVAKMKAIMASQHTRSADFPMTALDQ